MIRSVMAVLAAVAAAVIANATTSTEYAVASSECNPTAYPPSADTPAKRKLHKFSENMANRFVRHLRVRHADDPHARAALRNFSGKVVYSDASPSSGLFVKPCLVVRLDKSSLTPSGAMFNRGKYAAVLVHELAHAAAPGNGHGDDFRDALSKFYRWATEELGWKIDVSCQVCTGNGLCSRAMCPKCTFSDGDPARCPAPTWTRRYDLGNKRVDYSQFA